MRSLIPPEAAAVLRQCDERRQKARSKITAKFSEEMAKHRRRLIAEDEIDVLIPMLHREYEPINLAELWARRLRKWGARLCERARKATQ